jgi:hypothetical protein
MKERLSEYSYMTEKYNVTKMHKKKKRLLTLPSSCKPQWAFQRIAAVVSSSERMGL